MGFYKWRTDAIPTESVLTFTGNNFKYNLVTTIHTKDYKRVYGRGSYNYNGLALVKDFNGYRQLRFGSDQTPASSPYYHWYRMSNTTKNYYKIIYSDVELPADYFTPLTTINRVVGKYLLKPTVNITEDFIASEVSFIKNVSGTVSERLFYNIYTDNGNIYGVYTSKFWTTGSGTFINRNSLPGYDNTEYTYSKGSYNAGELIYSAVDGWVNGYTGELRFGSVIPIMKVFQDFIDNNSYQKNTNINIFYNDNVIGSATNLYEIKEVNLTSQNNTYTLVLYDVLNNSSTISFDVPVIENQIFRGLGLTPRTIDILPDVETKIDLHGDIELFLIYQKYRPVTEKFDIELYQNTAESNRVDKSLFLTHVTTISGALREQCSLISPTITIAYPKVPDFNYVYIEAFGRYYFVTGVVSVRYNLWEISLECDVLMTYKDKLLECEAFIDRNENTFNPLIVDRRKVIEQGQNIITLAAENEVFEGTGSYIISLSNGFMSTMYSYVYFDDGVTVKFNGKDVSSGSSAIAADRYPITIECTKKNCYINGDIYSAETTLSGIGTLYIHTSGATVSPFTITIIQ